MAINKIIFFANICFYSKFANTFIVNIRLVPQKHDLNVSWADLFKVLIEGCHL